MQSRRICVKCLLNRELSEGRKAYGLRYMRRISLQQKIALIKVFFDYLLLRQDICTKEVIFL